MMFQLNAIFHCMETRFVLIGNLDMILGEFGPVEAELLLSALLFLIGGYFGSDSILVPIGQTFPSIVAPDHFLNSLAPVQWNMVVGVIIMIISGIMLYDSL